MMFKKSLGLAILLSLATVASAQQPAAPKTHLKVGDPAPDFSLTDTAGKPV